MAVTVGLLHHSSIRDGEKRITATLTYDTVGIAKYLESYGLKGRLTSSLERFNGVVLINAAWSGRSSLQVVHDEGREKPRCDLLAFEKTNEDVVRDVVFHDGLDDFVWHRAREVVECRG